MTDVTRFASQATHDIAKQGVRDFRVYGWKWLHVGRLEVKDDTAYIIGIRILGTEYQIQFHVGQL